MRSRRVVTPQGAGPATLHIKDGKISAVMPHESFPRAEPSIITLDAGDKAVLPGLCDSHVHINEPGRTGWEGFETATAAAAAGGLTTLIDMPLNSSPATTTVENFKTKLEAAYGRLRVDCGFWGGLIPGNLAELEPLIEAGVSGFKAFLIDSGIADFPAVGEKELRSAMPVLAARGVPLLVHAELAASGTSPSNILKGDACRAASGDALPPGANYKTYLASRPKIWENAAVKLMIELCRETRCRTHIAHLSSAQALGILRLAKQEGLPISAETCPHYLSLCAEDIPAGRTEYKCSPPIREQENRLELWKALRQGVIDFIVSDHSPCAPELKGGGDFLSAWGGISSLQLLLPLVWSEAKEWGFGLPEVARFLACGPAALAGWQEKKGRLSAGNDADFIIFDPEAAFTVKPENIFHRHKLTPYAGRILNGVVEKTFLRGELIYEKNRLIGAYSGNTLLHKEHRHGKFPAAY